MTSPRFAFIDLDGTLLGPDKTISAANLAALDALRAAGVQIVPASGRHHNNIVSFRQIHDMGWVLSSQGAVVRHAPTGRILREVNMQAKGVANICERARDLGLTLMAYQREAAFMEATTRWTELYSAKAGWTPEICDFRKLPPEGFQKILWSDEPERIDVLAAKMQNEMAGDFQMVVTEPELLEFMAPGATKASGAIVLAAELGIDPRQTMAFGDGHNDVEILRWAGISVAMAHGRESARKAARFVTPPGPPETAFARAVEMALEV